jgi:magnesium-protoporphyrin O-methyltransferase
VTGCCARHGQEEFFGEKTAAGDARKYRRKGPDPMARSLARRAGARGVEGATVLEIGGGVGQVALELLKAGAASAEVVELLPAYEPYVRELASEAAVGERLSFRTADLAADPTAAAPADLVVMNKVVCCTPDGVALAGVAASLARRALVLSFPRQVWWAKAGLGTVNGYLRLRRRRFRVFVHPQAAIEGAVEAHGLVRVSERNGPLFRIAAFERV